MIREASPRARGRAAGTFRSTLGRCLALVVGSDTLDVRSDASRGSLPVEFRCPIAGLNGSADDNWQGEPAALFDHIGEPRRVGIVVHDGWNGMELEPILAAWRAMAAAASHGDAS